MKTPSQRFNPYLTGCLLAVLSGLWLSGCASPEERARRKEASSLKLYLEEEFDTGDQTMLVPIYRAKPMLVRINKQPFLDEGHLVDAKIVDVVGGFAIVLKFDFHGTLVLENVSNSYRGRRVAIYGMFTDTRWLAAPILNRRIADGRLAFTPDATREESERLVRGLNNIAIKLGNRAKSGQQPPSEESF